MVTKTGTTVGTVPFMSPEQARGEKVDARTDIWSLGVVMYHMIAGRLPFEGEYSDALIYIILNEDPPPLASLRGETPIELEHIVSKCLEKDRDHRYQNADELLMDLRRQMGTPIGADLSWSIVRKKILTPRVAIAAIGIVLLAVGLTIGPGLFLEDSDIIESIAVLPLENLSGDPEQDYLAAGLHEALITDLGKLTGFRRVIARTSVRRFQNTTLSTREISRELGVDALLTGSVLRSGNRVQVTAHLIRARSDDPIWSERFEREFRDVLSLQNEIVGTLARAIQLQLTPEEQTQLQSAGEVDPDAYEAYLKGRFEILKQTPEAFEKSKQYFYAALEIDPDFALAYAGLSFAWLMIGDSGYQPPGETFPRGKELLDKALELDSTSAEAYYYRATIQAAIDWDWVGAEAAFREALRINPNHADARYFLADLLLVLGRRDEWEKEVAIGRSLDPLNDFKRSFYGWHLNYVGRYDEAIPIFLELRETGPNKATNHLGLWGAYFKKGMYTEAADAAKDYFTEIGDNEFAEAVGSPENEAEYRAAMKRTGELMAKRSHERHVPAIRVARMFAHAADNDRAIEWLEKAYEAHESPIMRLNVFWDWDGLRSDPRFQDLLRRAGLPADGDQL